MEVILIAAMDPNGVIGYQNQIPWHVPEEMRFFKETTMGHAILMGRKTYESIGTILPGRTNIVLSGNPDYSLPDCQVFNTLPKAIASCTGQEKVFIIGGRTIYEQGFKYGHTILLSVMKNTYPGDTYFPDIPKEQYQLVSVEEMGDPPSFFLHTYRRTRVPAEE